MIQYRRRAKDEHAVAIQPRSSWFEIAGARAKAAVKQGKAHTFDENVYQHPEVRRALEKLFHRKCVYCESLATSTGSWDVEHFRPKSHYYWLAYTWENLYLSCPRCNQSRKDPPTWDDPQAGPAAGKLDQFPLAGAYRASQPADSLSRERRLLLDPCADRPERHMTFNIVGEAVPVRSSAKATSSIRVFNLNFKRLRDDRRVVIEARLALVKQFAVPPQTLEKTLAILADTLGADNQAFAGTTRAISRDPRSFSL